MNAPEETGKPLEEIADLAESLKKRFKENAAGITSGLNHATDMQFARIILPEGVIAAAGTYGVTTAITTGAMLSLAFPLNIAIALYGGYAVIQDIRDARWAHERNKELVSALGTYDNLLTFPELALKYGALAKKTPVETENTPEQWLKIMAEEVSLILGTDVQAPKLARGRMPDHLGGMYYWERDKIKLPIKRVRPSSVAHEFCHHVQRHSGNSAKRWKRNPALMEGLAVAVSRLAVENYSSKSGSIVDVGIYGRIEDYALDCILTYMHKLFLEDRDLKVLPYVIGTSAFLAAEAKHGAGIYKDIIKADKPEERIIDMLGGKR